MCDTQAGGRDGGPREAASSTASPIQLRIAMSSSWENQVLLTGSAPGA